MAPSGAGCGVDSETGRDARLPDPRTRSTDSAGRLSEALSSICGISRGSASAERLPPLASRLAVAEGWIASEMTDDVDRLQDVENEDSGSSDHLWPVLFIASVLVIVGVGVIIDTASTSTSDGGTAAEATTTTTTAGGEEPTTSTTTPPAGGGDAVLGEALYSSTCIACHGPTGVGIEGLGKQLADSDFVRALTDEELVAFIEVGRAPDDPDSMTGIQMPPKGGNPALADDDLLDIVAYLRTLN